MSEPYIAPSWNAVPTGTTPPAPPTLSSPRNRQKLGIAIGAGVGVVLALVGILGFWTPGFFISTIYDTGALQKGVLRVLRDNYEIAADAVACPPSVPVDEGLQFSCNALVGGQQRPVTIRVVADDGRFEVVRPQ
ncbi:DUF4333 domain-containing protein [Actinoplanes sp. NPDC051494]|uniref:DUF4333 domain-containing protein n=1 Tax=Actinoplanes sp. NPDC051494 TaxID=3363907 RepID=UPI0037AB47A1